MTFGQNEADLISSPTLGSPFYFMIASDNFTCMHLSTVRTKEGRSRKLYLRISRLREQNASMSILSGDSSDVQRKVKDRKKNYCKKEGQKEERDPTNCPKKDSGFGG